MGEGASGPTLQDTPRTRTELVEAIDVRMPPSDPSLCTGTCADDLADFIRTLSRDTTPTGCQEAAALPPQRLRLLHRRELANTLAALLDDAPSSIPACAWQTGSCDAGTGETLPCGTVQFVYRPDAPAGRVHLAGSFHGWPATVEQGGIPLQWAQDEGVWWAHAAVGVEAFAYKFVVDGNRWVVDPTNPAQEDDGFGGRNSVFAPRCEGAQGEDAVQRTLQALPEAPRPTGFWYDTHAEAALVQALHAEGYLAVAEAVAARMARTPEAWVSCAWDVDRDGCLRAWVEQMGPRFWRRPLRAEEAARLERFALAGPPDARAALRSLIELQLNAPQFLYRSELGVPTTEPGVFRLDAWETASLLSYQWTGGPPDAQLREAAATGRLEDPAELERQVRRMAELPTAREVVGRFGAQWLHVERVMQLPRALALFPAWTPDLQAALVEEARHFVAEVLLAPDGRFDDLYLASWTVARGAAARHYGFTDGNPTGERRTWPGGADRAGVLTLGAVLASTSHSDQTSPIRRGLFVRERLLCQHLPEPPANAGGVPDVNPEATTRERFRQHTDDPACASCHRYIDGLGFGFEALDPIGLPRREESGQPVDSTGEMVDLEGLGAGTVQAFETMRELGALLAESRRARLCVAMQYESFGLGEAERWRTPSCRVERALDRMAAEGGDLRTMMVAMSVDASWRLRRAGE
jgi:hypothetical protein